MSDGSDGRGQLNDTRDRISARVVGRHRELTLVLAAVAVLLTKRTRASGAAAH